MTPEKYTFQQEMIRLINDPERRENKGETKGGKGNADYDKSAKRHVPEINHFNVCAPLQHLDDPFRAFQS